ncbi:MAG: metalloenzyme [Melioribacteraceae bacterium]|nr:metalloenzyme [Melioribacteraceae bacterium]
MPRVLVIFLDGVGIGAKDRKSNPFFSKGLKFVDDVFNDTPHSGNSRLSCNGSQLFPIDACMGIEGLPQSGTGQTSILCGVNASEILCKHFGPFPHTFLLPYIKQKNLFKELMDLGKKVCFANAYPQIFFDYLNSGKTRIGVFARSVVESGIRLKNYSDVIKQEAITAEIINKVWKERLGYEINVITPQQAGENLLRICSHHDFTLFEYFLTDHLGHGRIKDHFDEITEVLDQFICHIIKNLQDDTTLLICSDHGNFEDLSVKQHTTNPALGISIGQYAKMLGTQIKSLYHIKPAIMNIFK